jgi:hypothetical protein
MHPNEETPEDGVASSCRKVKFVKKKTLEEKRCPK